MGVENSFLQYFPILKWVIGGLVGIIMMLTGYIFRKQQKQINELEIVVDQLARDSVNMVHREQFDEFKKDMDNKFTSLELHISGGLDSVKEQLNDIMWYMVNARNKSNQDDEK